MAVKPYEPAPLEVRNELKSEAWHGETYLNIYTVLKAGISILCFALLFTQISIEKLKLMLQHGDPLAVAWMLLLLYFLIILQAVRWWIIGKQLGLKWSLFLAIELAFVGAFFSQLLPSSMGGDAVRAWKLTRAGIPMGKAVNSVLLDRTSAFIAIGLIFCVGLPLLYAILGKYLGFVDASMLFTALCLACFAVGSATVAYRQSFRIRQNRLFVALVNFVKDARVVFLAPIPLVTTTLLSLVSQVAAGFIVWSLAMSFGAKLDFVEFSLLWPIVLILSLLPISIAGWGVREGAMVLAFTILGNPSEIAVAASISFGILMILVGAPGGIVWLISVNKRRQGQ